MSETTIEQYELILKEALGIAKRALHPEVYDKVVDFLSLTEKVASQEKNFQTTKRMILDLSIIFFEIECVNLMWRIQTTESKIASLQESKASQARIEPFVKLYETLKPQCKVLSGQEWPPSVKFVLSRSCSVMQFCSDFEIDHSEILITITRLSGYAAYKNVPNKVIVFHEVTRLMELSIL